MCWPVLRPRRPGGAERRNRRDLHGPRAPARTGPRRIGLADYTVSFAGSLEELRAGASEVGYPCVVKPVMSSSGHGQSVVRSADAIDAAWTEAQEGRRAADEGDVSRVIVEALAPLERELTVLTVSSSAGIVTCTPIGQRQESGDYRESWQPATEPDGEAERALRHRTYRR